MSGVSVIICTWNRSKLLRETLQSLGRQAGVAANEVEVIVVDNNSEDDTHAVVEALMCDWELGCLRYEFEPRQGKQFALNRGLRLATHPVLAFTDDDILFPSDWLLQVRAAFADPAVELAGGKTLVTWGPTGRPAWFGDDMFAVVGGIDLGDQRLSPAPPDYAPGGGNLLARKALFERVGGYSETHFRHMDHEFGMRCQTMGVHVVYDPSIVVYAPVDEQCLTPHYFRRWAFKAGIGRSGGVEAVGAGIPRVPAWIYRQVLEDWVATRFAGASPLTPDGFSRELRMWRGWGTIANAWHAWQRPKAHAEWVKLKSQKTSNLY